MEDLKNPKFSKKGYVQIYTGEGKGKTSSCIGLACRALGRNFHVLIMQFCKVCNTTGEYKCLTRYNKNLVYKSCGLPHFPTKNSITDADKKAAQKGWNYVKNNLNNFDLIILDELNVAIDLDFVSLEDTLDLIKNKPKNLELVLSGRHARQELINVAQLVTEMKPIKHYWDLKVPARIGIEY